MNEFLTLTLSALLLTDTVPTAKRVELLKPYFHPVPGSTVTLDANDVRDFGSQSLTKALPTHLRGFIKITPPKGQCLTIRKQTDAPDIRVCKKEQQVFTLGDLDRAGRVTWTVSTGDQDFGTELSWHTPYRLAMVEPVDTPPEDPPQYLFVERCDTDQNTVLGRRVIIRLFGGKEWTVRLPAKDELLPQPDPPPNLFIASGRPKGGIPGDDAKKKSEGGEKPQGESHGGGGEHGKAEEKKEAPSGSATAAKQEDEMLEDRAKWSIPARDGFKLDSSMFSTGVPLLRGVEGECRYRYDGPEEDPQVGRLECHQVGGYRHLYVPLTCLGQLKPRQMAPKHG